MPEVFLQRREDFVNKVTAIDRACDYPCQSTPDFISKIIKPELKNKQSPKLFMIRSDICFVFTD